ncbi:MAG: thiamine diphosphokinase [Caloramator sp.]|nr:thiamine diphosphokinase [Caloramator sp.]
MKKALIFNFGRINNSTLLQKEVQKADIILCADGGGNYAYELGIIPHFLIGDFDSIEPKVLDYYIDKGVNVIRYPKEKDYTDTELCINIAIEEGCKEICILGGVGGRIDHTLANLYLLHYIYEHNAMGYIVTDDFYIYMCKDSIKIEGEIGDIVSIIPIYKSAKALYSKGLMYRLENTTIDFGRSLGISNVMIDRQCEVKVGEGEVLIFKKI